MLEYLPVRGSFKANLAWRKLSDDPAYVPDLSVNLRFTPGESDERIEFGSSTTEGEGGVADKMGWARTRDAEELGTYVYRAFVFPDRWMRETLRGGFMASDPVIIRVVPAAETEPEE